MSLRWRIAAALGVVAALVCAFGAIAAYVSTSQRLENSVDESLLARRKDLSGTPEPHGRRRRSDDRVRRRRRRRGVQPPERLPGAVGVRARHLPRSSSPSTARAPSCIEGSAKLPTDATDRAIAQGTGGAYRIAHGRV